MQPNSQHLHCRLLLENTSGYCEDFSSQFPCGISNQEPVWGAYGNNLKCETLGTALKTDHHPALDRTALFGKSQPTLSLCKPTTQIRTIFISIRVNETKIAHDNQFMGHFSRSQQFNRSYEQLYPVQQSTECSVTLNAWCCV